MICLLSADTSHFLDFKWNSMNPSNLFNLPSSITSVDPFLFAKVQDSASPEQSRVTDSPMVAGLNSSFSSSEQQQGDNNTDNSNNNLPHWWYIFLSVSLFLSERISSLLMQLGTVWSPEFSVFVCLQLYFTSHRSQVTVQCSLLVSIISCSLQFRAARLWGQRRKQSHQMINSSVEEILLLWLMNYYHQYSDFSS